MKSTRVFVILMSLLVTPNFLGAPSLTRVPVFVQNRDLMGGADVIFLRPPNPPLRRRKTSDHPASGLPQTEKKKPATAAKPADNVSPSAGNVADQVEDALALGNAARDRQPPDLSSAEKAYRLAWKLNPNDARPFVGHGNVYMEQERFPEAARAYREAIRLGMPRTVTLGVVGGFTIHRQTATPDEVSAWRLFAAVSLMRQNELLSAERELTTAIEKNPNDAKAHALLAYVLFTQQRFTEAAALYKMAAQLDSTNVSYQQALAEASQKSAATSVQDAELRKRIEGTAWEVRDSDNSRPTSTCEVRARDFLKCTPSASDKFLLTNRRWNLQDATLKITSYPGGSSFCTGRLDGEVIRFTCLFGDEEKTQVWTKKS